MRRRLSPSLLLAIVAIVLASTGSAVAAKLITSKDIKNNTIASTDIKNGTIKLGDVSKGASAALRGQAGPQGARGQAGSEGARGPAGSAGAPGGSSLPVPIPAARVNAGGVTQNITGSTETPAAFPAEEFDTASLHSNVTNNTRLTAPIAGLYQVSAGVQWSSVDATTARALRIVVNHSGDLNAAVHAEVEGAPPAGNHYARQNVSTLVKLAAGDFVEAWVYQETGASIDIGEAFSSNPRRTFLAMTWVAAG